MKPSLIIAVKCYVNFILNTTLAASKQVLVHVFLLLFSSVGFFCSPRDSQESSPTPEFKSINSSALSFLHSPTLTSIHDHRKTIALTRRTFLGKIMSLRLNILYRLVITFLPRSKRLLISWLQSQSVVILDPQKNKV